MFSKCLSYNLGIMSDLYLGTVQSIRTYALVVVVFFYSMFFKQWELHLKTVKTRLKSLDQRRVCKLMV